MSTARGVETARGRPCPARRVVQLRTRENDAIITPCNEHLPVGQQRRRVITARGVETARRRPGPACRIVQFRAPGRRRLRKGGDPPRNQHHPVGQQRRRVLTASGVETARGDPGPACRMVQFRARLNAAGAESPCNQHHPVGQQGRRVLIACGVETARRRPGRTHGWL